MKKSAIHTENAVGPSFQIEGDGSMLIPYGVYPHRKGRQRFEREQAENVVSQFRGGGASGLISKVVNWVRGVPIYIGHPDVPGREKEFTDKKAYGWAESMTAENDGLRIHIDWSKAGRALWEDKHYRYYSPYWGSDPVRGELHPAEMISVGLTNDPNIPVPALANDADEGAEESDETPRNEANEEEAMKKELAEILGKEDTISDEDLLAEVKRIVKAAADNEEKEKKDPPKIEEKDKADEKEKAENDRVLALGRRADSALDLLILSNRLAPGERASTKEDLVALENDEQFDAKIEELSKAEPILKTESETEGLAKKGQKVGTENEAEIRKEARAEAIRNYNARTGNTSYETAFAACSKADPELFSK